MGNITRQIDYDEMEKSSDEKARDRFKRPAYQVRKMIREQGKQIIRKGVDAGGQRNPD
ncbi:MAG: hypothetical protein H2212_00160 [Ruminococcus sp.]|nr:hypothetical protein [Ruminococcus sp.]